MKRSYLIIPFVLILSQQVFAQSISQFLGPDRNSIYPGTGLLKSWPEGGPELLWFNEEIGKGFSSVSVTDNEIFVTGRIDSTEYLTALDLEGNQLWKLPYGLGIRRSYKETRCTPTVEGDRIYIISGRGEVVCINKAQKKIQWSIPGFEKFQGRHWRYEIAESPLLVDDKVIYSPGGPLTTMVALNKHTGETVWQTSSLSDTSAYVSPILIEHEGRKIIVNVMINHILGVDANDGEILWKFNYSDFHPPVVKAYLTRNNMITPLYHDGRLFITSGNDHVAVMFELLKGGREIKPVWVNSTFDIHHGQVVKIGNYIYGANWLHNNDGKWCCVDWRTGEIMYEKEWVNKGAVIAADGLLYCYEEKRGNVALVEPTPEDFKIISSFKISKGRGQHWALPVISQGVLYIRHGEALMAYDIKK